MAQGGEKSEKKKGREKKERTYKEREKEREKISTYACVYHELVCAGTQTCAHDVAEFRPARQ
jgi:hypothetical protein